MCHITHHGIVFPYQLAQARPQNVLHFLVKFIKMCPGWTPDVVVRTSFSIGDNFTPSRKSQMQVNRLWPNLAHNKLLNKVTIGIHSQQVISKAASAQTTIFNRQQYLENGSSIHRHFWRLSQRGALRPLRVFIATSSRWSIKLFTALPGYCQCRLQDRGGKT